MITEIKSWVGQMREGARRESEFKNHDKAIDNYYKALGELGGVTGDQPTLDGIRRFIVAKVNKLNSDHMMFGIPFHNPRYRAEAYRYQRASALSSGHDFNVIIDWLNQERLHSLENLLAWKPERMDAALYGQGLRLWDGTQNGAIATMIYGKDTMTLHETGIPINARVYFGTKAAIAFLQRLRGSGVEGSEQVTVPEQIQQLEKKLKPFLPQFSKVQ